MKIAAAGRYTKEELAKIVSEGKNYREVMITLGYTTPKGNSLTALKRILDKQGIPHDHLKQWSVVCLFCGKSFITKSHGGKYHYRCQLKKYYQEHKEERLEYQNKYAKTVVPIKKEKKIKYSFGKVLKKFRKRRKNILRETIQKALFKRWDMYSKIEKGISLPCLGIRQWVSIVKILGLKRNDCLELVEVYMADRRLRKMPAKIEDKILLKMKEICIINEKKRRGRIWNF